MNKEEFITLIKQNKKILYKVCNTYCKDAIDRQDLEQEICIQLWLSMQRYDGRVKMTTWMYKIALNTAISYYRKTKTQQKYRSSSDIAILSISDDTNVLVDDQISLLYTFIDGLNKMNKALILLYLENVKQKEIAEVLGITETNVATKLGRIKESLKSQFNNFK